MRILVTGGAGYIGSHTAKLLATAGHQPITVDNLSTGHPWAVQWGPIIRADLSDTVRVRRVLHEHQVEAVMHFAGSAYVGESLNDPKKYFHNNVVNALNLLNVMHDCGIRNIVFSSSCATYGAPDQVRIDENVPQLPVNPYGESKLMVERMLRWFGKSYGLCWVALRYFNAAGADSDGEIGELHDPETHLIPLALDASLAADSPIRVFGTNYPTSDGTAIRDYVHVWDLAEAHLAALEYLVDGGESQALNLGTGQGHSVLDVLRAVECIAGRPVPTILTDRRPGDPAVLVADARRARALLGWHVKYIDLQEVIETAWRWHVSSKRQSLMP